MNASLPLTAVSIVPSAKAERFGKTILLINGIALGATGLVQAHFDLAGSFFGMGPMGSYLQGKVDTVGFFEAHMLAFILAVLILMHRKADRPTWNWVAAGIHLLLGTANLMFWGIFVDAGQLPLGIISTSAHGLFFGLELIAAFARTPAIFAARGAVFRGTALITLGTGIVLHVSSLIMGRDAFVQQLFTPTFDAIFAIPMTIAGVSAIWLYRSAIFPALWQRLVYIFIAFYFTLSFFLHLSTLITWDTGYVLGFPAWYPIVALTMMVSLSTFVIRQRFADVPARNK
jgi:hypothetical protein